MHDWRSGTQGCRQEVLSKSLWQNRPKHRLLGPIPTGCHLIRLHVREEGSCVYWGGPHPEALSGHVLLGITPTTVHTSCKFLKAES